MNLLERQKSSIQNPQPPPAPVASPYLQPVGAPMALPPNAPPGRNAPALTAPPAPNGSVVLGGPRPSTPRSATSNVGGGVRTRASQSTVATPIPGSTGTGTSNNRRSNKSKK